MMKKLLAILLVILTTTTATAALPFAKPTKTFSISVRTTLPSFIHPPTKPPDEGFPTNEPTIIHKPRPTPPITSVTKINPHKTTDTTTIITTKKTFWTRITGKTKPSTIPSIPIKDTKIYTPAFNRGTFTIPVIPIKTPVKPPFKPTTKTTSTSNDTNMATMYATFMLRHGGYIYAGQTYKNGIVIVKFKVYDDHPAPMFIKKTRIPIYYPSGENKPKVIGIVYHYMFGHINRIEKIYPINGPFSFQ